MNWLKKIAAVILKGVGIATGFLPLLQGVIPQRGADVVRDVADDLTKVAGIIVTVEAAAAALKSPLPGSEKLVMATPLVAQVILQSDLLVNNKIKDDALFQKGCASIASGMADVLNSLKGD